MFENWDAGQKTYFDVTSRLSPGHQYKFEVCAVRDGLTGPRASVTFNIASEEDAAAEKLKMLAQLLLLVSILLQLKRRSTSSR